MKRTGLEKARRRLAQAFRSLEALSHTQTSHEFLDTWANLLSAMNAAFVILLSSGKGDAKSEAWCGQLKSIQKNDELLNYLRQARNANDHGIEQVLDVSPAGWAMPMPSSGALYIEKMVVENGELVALKADGHGAPVEFHQFDKVRLAHVTNRGRTFPVPQHHLGSRITDRSPLNVAKLGLTFLAKKFAEAEQLAR